MKLQEKLDKLGDRLKKNHEKMHPHDLLEKGRKYDALKKSNDELVEALKELMELINTNNLVRNISRDNEIKYFLEQGVRINNVLFNCQQALKNNEND